MRVSRFDCRKTTSCIFEDWYAKILSLRCENAIFFFRTAVSTSEARSRKEKSLVQRFSSYQENVAAHYCGLLRLDPPIEVSTLFLRYIVLPLVFRSPSRSVEK
ncbi:hypothetical protein P5V15_007721 [Pogonomyrmex californicus]